MVCVCSTIRVDCIAVSTLPVKASIDDHLQQLFEALLSSLRRSISASIATIDDFLVKGKSALSVRPQTVEEIGDVNESHMTLAKQKPQVGMTDWTLCNILRVLRHPFPLNM